MTCTNYNRKYLEKPLKSVLKTRNGNEAEINLLLTAMFRKAGFRADPVMLSTRSHGYTYAMYPLMDRFNYVISRLKLDGQVLLPRCQQAQDGFWQIGHGVIQWACKSDQ